MNPIRYPPAGRDNVRCIDACLSEGTRFPLSSGEVLIHDVDSNWNLCSGLPFVYVSLPRQDERILNSCVPAASGTK